MYPKKWIRGIQKNGHLKSTKRGTTQREHGCWTIVRHDLDKLIKALHLRPFWLNLVWNWLNGGTLRDFRGVTEVRNPQNALWANLETESELRNSLLKHVHQRLSNEISFAVFGMKLMEWLHLLPSVKWVLPNLGAKPGRSACPPKLEDSNAIHIVSPFE